MIYVLPRVWHYGDTNFVRSKNPLTVTRRFAPYEHRWRRVRRLLPGLWIGRGSWFFDHGDGFVRGAA